MVFTPDVKKTPTLAAFLHGMPLLWISSTFLVGLLLASWQHQPWWVWLAAALVCAGLALFILHRGNQSANSGPLEVNWQRFSSVPFWVVAAVLFLGAARYQVAIPQPSNNSLRMFTGNQNALVQGIVVDTPQTGVQLFSLRVQVESLSLLDNKQRLVSQISFPEGLLLAQTPSLTDWQYGDRVRLEGELQDISASSTPSFRDTLYRQGVQAIMPFASANLMGRDQGLWWNQAAEEARRYCKQVLYRLFPQPEGALLSGILIGDDNDLPENLQNAFKDTGTAHIIAISGFNMAIVAGLLTLFAGRFLTRFWSLWVVGLGIVFYTLLTGATPSVVRAAVMGVMGLLGSLIGRRQVGLNSLVFSAAAMSLADPFLPWNISFQLSFGATLGLVLYAEPLTDYVFGLTARWFSEGWASLLTACIGETFLCTLSAQITTLPIMLYHFQRLSLSALLANILVLPPQSALMICGGLALLAGLIFLPLGQLLALPAWVLLVYTTHMVSLLAGIQGSVLFVDNLPLWLVALAYIIMICLTPVVFNSLSWIKNSVKPGIILLGLGLGAVLTVRTALSMPDGHLHVTLLGGGEQATLLLRPPGGDTFILNGTTISGNLSGDVGRRLPPTKRDLGVWVLTDPSGSAIQEFELLSQRFSPQAVYHTGLPAKSIAWRRLSANLALQGTKVNLLQPGQLFNLGSGASLEVLAANDQGAAFFLQWQNLRLLIPGGLGLQTILKSANGHYLQEGLLVLGKADLAGDQTNQDWSQLKPTAVLVCAGDSMNLPNWINVSKPGGIEINSDGQQLWLESAF